MHIFCLNVVQLHFGSYYQMVITAAYQSLLTMPNIHHNISHRHPYIILAPSNYSASIEDHKLLLVSLQRHKSNESETLHLFTEVGLKLVFVLCTACLIAGFVSFCMRWLPRKAAKYRRLSSVPGLRERYKPRTQCLLNEETDQQGSDTERCTVTAPILNEVTRI